YRESWHTQWTSVQVQSYSPEYECTTGPNTWCIKNRLTGAFLANTKDGIIAWESDLLAVGSNKFKTRICIPEYSWRFDLGPDRSWRIINHSNSCLLERVQGSSTEVACTSKNVSRNKSWLFRYVSGCTLCYLVRDTEASSKSLVTVAESESEPPAYILGSE
ncbi:hypothetical protein Q9L58_009767, partial [Maublancomyces gigas]